MLRIRPWPMWKSIGSLGRSGDFLNDSGIGAQQQVAQRRMQRVWARCPRLNI
jgi:hypothetical protein